MAEVDGDLEIAANDVRGEWRADEDIIKTGVAFALCKQNKDLLNFHKLVA